jgi:hypothetical protein
MTSSIVLMAGGSGSGTSGIVRFAAWAHAAWTFCCLN